MQDSGAASEKRQLYASGLNPSANSAVDDTQIIHQYLSPHPGTAVLDSEVSRVLYEYYFNVTSQRLGGKPASENPFVTYILPLASFNPLIMQTVVAVGGAHLACHAQFSDSPAISTVPYDKALQAVGQSLRQLSAGRETNVLHIISTILLLSQIEAISGNTEGAAFHHLRGCRSLLVSELAKTHSRSDEDLLGFLVELYAYMALVQNVAPSTASSSRTLPLDSFTAQLEPLRRFKSFGVMFGCAHDLFELIPTICAFGSQREEDLQLGGPRETEHVRQYHALQSCISNWQPSLDISGDASWVTQQQIVGAAYQKAVLIFLHAAFHQTTRADARILAVVQPLVDAMLSLLGSWMEFTGSPLNSILLWPAMIAGSCLHKPEQRVEFAEAMARIDSDVEMGIITQAKRLLALLWSEPDAYGPIALDRTMKAHGINFCMA